MKLVLNIEGVRCYCGGDDKKAAELARAAGFDAVDYDICRMEKGADIS